MKLTTKSLLTNFIAPLILFLGVIFFTFGQITKYKLADVSDTQRAVLEAASSEIKSTLESNKTLLKSGSNFKSIINIIDLMPQNYIESEYELIPEYKIAKSNLSDLLGKNSNIDYLYISSINSPGLVANNWLPLPSGYDARGRGWYKGAKDSNDIFITPPYLDANTATGNAMIITMSYPIKDGSKFKGVIAMDFSIGDVTKAVDNVQKENPHLSITLFNGTNQQVLYNKTTSFEDNVFVKDLFVPLGYTDSMQKDFMKLFENVYKTGEPGSFDAHRVVTLHKVEGTPWLIAAAFNKKDLINMELKETKNTYFLATIVFIIVLLFGFMMSRILIFRPLTDLSTKFYNISHGEGDLTVKIIRKTNDELGHLANNFNNFIEKIRLMMVTVKETTASIEEKQYRVSDTTKETASSSIEINSNVTSINNQIEDLNGQLQSVSSAMDEIGATVKSLFNSTETQTKAVDEASSSIEQMVAQLDSVARIVNIKKGEAEKLTIIINESGKQISDATTANEEVVELAGKVADMSEVISNIASQTNLLSMNAAIEAAHAGDAGKGFAVVADEIRKLAEVAQDSSTEIKDTISNILNKVDIAYKISKESEDTFQKLRDGTQSTIQALEEINVSTQELSQGGALIINANTELSHASTQVRESAQEMSDTISLITESTRTAADISHHVKEGVVEISQGIEDISTSVNLINNFTEEVTINTNLLNTETDKFKT